MKFKTWPQLKKAVSAAREEGNMLMFLVFGHRVLFPNPSCSRRDVVIQKVDFGLYSCNPTHQTCEVSKTHWLKRKKTKPLLLSEGYHPRNRREPLVWLCLDWNPNDHGKHLGSNSIHENTSVFRSYSHVHLILVHLFQWDNTFKERFLHAFPDSTPPLFSPSLSPRFIHVFPNALAPATFQAWFWELVLLRWLSHDLCF